MLLAKAQIITPVYVVLFTHIEDGTPAAGIGTPQARLQYVNTRNGMIEMAKLAKRHSVQWVFQPDWKILLACLEYEDSLLRANTNGKNLLRYLSEDMGVAVDPHSHEKQGYNYTDVAHLLDSLGVGGSTVIGGHVWDPSLPQFQNWDRFRAPVPGSRFPWASWRGDILMGSGTPNHVNDPCPSGIWRPRDRDHYWEDDTAGNIVCVGQYTGDVSGVADLIRLYRTGVVHASNILTASFHIMPSSITAPAGLAAVEDTVIKPLAALRDRGEVVLTDFSTLVGIWKSRFASRAHLYDGKNPPLPNSVGTFVPSEAGGSEGIYVEITFPDSARYPEGAPVVVHIAGGWGAEGLSVARDAMTPGFVEIRYNFPGGGIPGKASGGSFDDRGENCIRATRDVIRFAMGKIPDRNGKYLRDFSGGIHALPGNVGLCGWSNGGNATLTAAGMLGDELRGLAWIVNWESPVGDGMPTVDAGTNGNVNPAYDAATGAWDLSRLAYSDTLLVSKPGLPELRGGLYFDLDGSGSPEAGRDWFLTPYASKSAPVRTYYSLRNLHEAVQRGLIPPAAPPHLANVDETVNFWQWRNGFFFYTAAVIHNPGLMFIAAASDTDHVQGAADHPHVLEQYDGLLRAGARFVRLNADRSYCELLAGHPMPQAVDNDAFHVFTHTTIASGLQPEGARKVPDRIYTSAAILELADRTQKGVLTPNLDEPIDPRAGTEVSQAPGRLGMDMELTGNPVRGAGLLRVSLASPQSVRIEVVDMAGRTVAAPLSARLERGTHWLPLPALVPGVYAVLLRGERGVLGRRFVQL